MGVNGSNMYYILYDIIWYYMILYDIIWYSIPFISILATVSDWISRPGNGLLPNCPLGCLRHCALSGAVEYEEPPVSGIQCWSDFGAVFQILNFSSFNSKIELEDQSGNVFEWFRLISNIWDLTIFIFLVAPNNKRHREPFTWRIHQIHSRCTPSARMLAQEEQKTLKSLIHRTPFLFS